MAEFYVKIETECDEFKIEDGDIVGIELTEVAENGRANAELVRELAEILGQKPGIVSGHHSNRKKLKINMSEEKVKERLEGF